jgi:hypothetical protein
MGILPLFESGALLIPKAGKSKASDQATSPHGESRGGFPESVLGQNHQRFQRRPQYARFDHQLREELACNICIEPDLRQI